MNPKNHIRNLLVAKALQLNSHISHILLHCSPLSVILPTSPARAGNKHSERPCQSGKKAAYAWELLVRHGSGSPSNPPRSRSCYHWRELGHKAQYRIVRRRSAHHSNGLVCMVACLAQTLMPLHRHLQPRDTTKWIQSRRHCAGHNYQMITGLLLSTRKNKLIVLSFGSRRASHT